MESLLKILSTLLTSFGAGYLTSTQVNPNAKTKDHLITAAITAVVGQANLHLSAPKDKEKIKTAENISSVPKE